MAVFLTFLQLSKYRDIPVFRQSAISTVRYFDSVELLRQFVETLGCRNKETATVGQIISENVTAALTTT